MNLLYDINSLALGKLTVSIHVNTSVAWHDSIATSYFHSLLAAILYHLPLVAHNRWRS